MYRDLEKVRKIIQEATGLEVSYAYDDLVFPDHSAFIIQFDDDVTQNLNCYFHVDCDIKEKMEIFESLNTVATKNKCTIEIKGMFNMEQKNEEVEIKFINNHE